MGTVCICEAASTSSVFHSWTFIALGRCREISCGRDNLSNGVQTCHGNEKKKEEKKKDAQSENTYAWESAGNIRVLGLLLDFALGLRKTPLPCLFFF